jgi:uncharacterized membrane protein
MMAPMAAHPAESSPRKRRTTRFEAFSDGVFAIAITLLVLEITVPPGSETDLLRALADQWPSYLAYAVSFVTIGAVWLGHNAITAYLDHIDEDLVRLNLLLLMVVSLLPFPTHLLAEYVNKEGPERVASTVYGVNLLLTALLLWALWSYVRHQGLVRPDASDDEIETLSARLKPTVAGYLVLIGVGLFLPIVAVVGYLAVALYLLVPVRWLGRLLFKR